MYYLYTGISLTATDLCERCEEDKATISRAVEYLENNGFLTCRSQHTKRYKSPLALTEKGKEAGKKIADKIDGVLDAVSTELALELADRGLEAARIAERLEEEKKKILIVALVDTLEYLKKGGRVSKSLALAGTLLNIKPVLSVAEGEITMLGKARGSKMGNNLLIQQIDKAGGVDFTKPVLLGYSGLSDALLLKYIDDSRQIWEGNLPEIRYTSVGSVIGTHAGPGAVVVAFFKK